MSDIIACPNCEASMNDGESCPECEHDDRDAFCGCDYCTDARNSMVFDDDWMFGGFTPGDCD